MLHDGVAEFTRAIIGTKLKSYKQRYRLTDKGMRWLKEHREDR